MRPRLLAYAQLLRLPNVFTAFADILLGSLWTFENDHAWFFRTLWLLLASGCLYSAGMVWNDVFDRREDAKTRPGRPIPSGRIALPVAVGIGTALLLLGVFFTVPARGMTITGMTSINPLTIGISLAGAILLYDAWLKRTPLGPVGMGACRFLNVLLGFSNTSLWFDAADDGRFIAHVSAVVGVYITGVTWFARTEEGTSRKQHLVYASLVMLAALGLAVTVPAHREPGTTFFLYPYFLLAFGFYVGLPITRAIHHPGPKQVQAAVKRCILGLVVLDAVLAFAFVGPAGLLIVLLLLPAAWLGKWVYST
jgi:4-hydroxybenzoate polyprenyltransferase